MPLTTSLSASIHTHASELCQPRSPASPAAAASRLSCCTRPSNHSASGWSCAALPPSAGAHAAVAWATLRATATPISTWSGLA